MLSQITLMPILGYPAIMYGGILTFLIVLVVAIMGYRINKGKCKLPNPIKWHQTLAWIAVILGLGHSLLGLAIIIGF